MTVTTVTTFAYRPFTRARTRVTGEYLNPVTVVTRPVHPEMRMRVRWPLPPACRFSALRSPACPAGGRQWLTSQHRHSYG